MISRLIWTSIFNPFLMLQFELKMQNCVMIVDPIICFVTVTCENLCGHKISLVTNPIAAYLLFSMLASVVIH